MCVEEPGECHCSCHASLGIRAMHIVPCCTQCPICRKRIAYGAAEHIEACKQRQAEIAKLVNR